MEAAGRAQDSMGRAIIPVFNGVSLRRWVSRPEPELNMNEEQVNLSLRKFLKKVGVTSQREIESVIREGLAGGQLQDNDVLRVKMTLNVQGNDINVIEDTIDLG